jgi:hypothetical protein
MISNPRVVVQSFGRYGLLHQSEKAPGCFAYDTIRVTVNHSPAVDLGPDQSFCKGDSATFNAGAGFSSYAWSTGGALSTITVKAAGQYQVKATTPQGCHSYDTVSVLNVWELPAPRLDKKTELCAGESGRWIRAILHLISGRMVARHQHTRLLVRGSTLYR